jgi:hypothetical protein
LISISTTVDPVAFYDQTIQYKKDDEVSYCVKINNKNAYEYGRIEEDGLNAQESKIIVRRTVIKGGNVGFVKLEADHNEDKDDISDE